MQNSDQDDDLFLRQMKAEGGLAPARAPAPSVATLVAYLSGALPDREALQTEAALATAQDPGARKLFRQTAEHLLALRSTPWSRVREIADGDGIEAEVASAWLRILGESVETAPRALRWWREGRPASEPRRSSADDAVARTAWTLFSGFCTRLPPLGLAAARGGDPGPAEPAVNGLQGEIESAEVDSGGALHVKARVRAESGGPLPDGAWVQLALSLGGGSGETWPMGRAAVEDGIAEWRIEEFSRAAQLLSGHVTLQNLARNLALRLVEDRDAEEADGVDDIREGEAARIPTELADEDGERSPLRSSGFLISPPIPDGGGRVVLEIRAPEEILRSYSDHALIAEMAITPTSRQRIEVWTPDAWAAPDQPLLLELPFEAALGSPIRDLLRLVLSPIQP